MVLCAFDRIELDGEDLRWQPIEDRKSRLQKLIDNQHAGIAFNNLSTSKARLFSIMPASSAVKASCRNASARRIGPAASTTGSRSKTQGRLQQNARRKRTGAVNEKLDDGTISFLNRLG